MRRRQHLRFLFGHYSDPTCCKRPGNVSGGEILVHQGHHEVHNEHPIPPCGHIAYERRNMGVGLTNTSLIKDQSADAEPRDEHCNADYIGTR
jgi:hypothetical protein